MQEFFDAAAAKSWLTVVSQSSHTEFLNAGFILNRAFAALCGARGSNSFQVSQHQPSECALHTAQDKVLHEHIQICMTREIWSAGNSEADSSSDVGLDGVAIQGR